MARASSISVDVHLDAQGAPTTMREEIRRALAESPRRLPSKYFYDETGSRLFERITELPEYYLTRAEQALLDARAAEIARIARPRALMELGSGSAKKTRALIEACLAAGRLSRYVPVEVSEEIALQSARRLARAYPDLEIHVAVADFERDLGKLPDERDALIALLGSTLGNFPRPEAVRLLSQVPHLVRDGGFLLLGVDLVKEPATLEAAYNDAEGVTAEFNRNILRVVNGLLDGDFDPEAYRHESVWNPELERIETALVAERPQTVTLAGIATTFELSAGERLRTEVSCKYRRESLEEILAASGLALAHWFPDADGAFALALAAAAAPVS